VFTLSRGRYRGKSFFYLMSASRLRARAPKTEELKIYVLRFACPRYRVAAIAAKAFFI
jgi:hypothetical protein